jgi:hypothetical protein
MMDETVIITGMESGSAMLKSMTGVTLLKWKFHTNLLSMIKILAEWGVDFDRWIPWLTEDQYWCRYEKNEGQRVSKFGRLIFLRF